MKQKWNWETFWAWFIVAGAIAAAVVVTGCAQFSGKVSPKQLHRENKELRERNLKLEKQASKNWYKLRKSCSKKKKRNDEFCQRLEACE